MAISKKPARTPEEQEQIMIALAMECAEKQLREGTASSQVITHYLKLASSREKLEQEIKEKEKQLLEAKTENLQSNTRLEEMYTKCVDAMKLYGGCISDEDNEEEFDVDEY